MEHTRGSPRLQSKTSGGLRRLGADTLAERIGRSRTRRVQGRQSAVANDDDPTRLAVAATPTRLSAEPLVSRPCPAQRRTDAQDDHRRTRAQAAGRPLEICNQRYRYRGRRLKGRLRAEIAANPHPQGLISPGGSRGANRTPTWPKQPR